MPDGRRLSILEALREALAEEMERDQRVVLLGEDIGALGGVFRVTDGLLDRYGPARVVDAPMSELGIVGISVGLAMRGMRPVAEIQFADFIHAAADHLIGEAAKIRYRTAGDWTCPLVVRTAYGGGFRGGPYHSQSIEAYYAHVPGLKVVAPSFPADAKGMLTAAIRDPDPVLFLEHKGTYRAVTGEVPEGEHIEELGRAKVVRSGDDVTILAWGKMLHESLSAAELLSRAGVEADVIDVRSLLPLDRETLLASVRRTGRLCVVHEDTRTMGLGAELVAQACESCLDVLKAAPIRLTMPDIGGIPVADPMEDAALPERNGIAASILEAVRHPARTTAIRDFDPVVPEATSLVHVSLGSDHLQQVMDAVEIACGEFPDMNAEFTWQGIKHHPSVRFDLDLGPRSPARGDGTITIVDYGPDGSLFGLPAVRPRQTAALRVGAVRDGAAWLALSVDHRAVDGAVAGRFLSLVKNSIESGGRTT